jgi:hypothetical protein
MNKDGQIQIPCGLENWLKPISAQHLAIDVEANDL